MRTGNKATRDKAIPFISNPLSINATSGYGMLTAPQNLTTAPFIAAVPMTTPEKADIVEAYLYMEMTAPSDKPLKVRLAIGRFTELSGGVLRIIPETSYLEAYIDQEHRKIAGTDAPFEVAANGTLIIDADLTRNLLKRGDTGFSEDAFVLLVVFDSTTDAPDNNDGYSLDKFKLSCTAQMGLGT